MSATEGSGLLVLNREVEIVPVREFPLDIRQRLGGRPSDFIVSHQRSRITSRRIEEEAALLLRRFVKPRRIVEAVIEHSTELQRDPTEVLNEVYDLVTTFRSEGVLVDPESKRSYVLGPSLTPGALFEGFRIIECIRGVAETEVYKAESVKGSLVAIKYLRAGSDEIVKASLEREASVLDYLDRHNCSVTPRIYDAKVDRDDPYVCMEWFSGFTLFDLYQNGSSTVAERASVIPPLLDAYRCLHSSGVLHGDVHPRNVLILSDGAVKLIDFGGALLPDDDDSYTRIGVVQYYEPEVARALLEGFGLPKPTKFGEQYAVANLAYSAITQTSPVILSLETETALKQVASDPPRGFNEIGLSWPAVEDVLLRALSKSPTERFATFDDFSTALSEALLTTTPLTETALPALPGIVAGSRNELLEACCQRFIEGYGLANVHAGIDLIRGPTASLYAGAAGIAYALLRVACLRQDPASLAAADVWISWALQRRQDSMAFTDGSVGASTQTGPLALFHSETGLYAVKAMIRHASHDELETQWTVKEFVDAIPEAAFDPNDSASLINSFSLDATNGASSLLLGVALLAPLCDDQHDVTALRLKKVGTDLAGVVFQQLRAARVANCLLGFAHGKTGAVYSLLRWAQVSNVTLAEEITDVLDELAASGKREGQGLAWPIVGGDAASPVWTGWCHGSAGHLLTWITAAQVLQRSAYLEIALDAGRYIWELKGQSGSSLCCGAAGEALSLFELARASGDSIWIDRGLALAEKAVQMIDEVNDAQGLFRADVGIALAAFEARSPGTSSWPICQSPFHSELI